MVESHTLSCNLFYSDHKLRQEISNFPEMDKFLPLMQCFPRSRAEEYPWSFFRHKRQNVLTERFRSITVTLNRRCTAIVQAIKERRIIFRLVWHKIWNIAIQNTQHEIGDTKEKHKIQSKRNLKCNKLHGLCSNRLGRHIFHSVWDRGVEREFGRTFVLPIVLFVVVFVFILTSPLKLFCLWNRNNFWIFS